MRKVEEEMVLAIEFFARNGYMTDPHYIKCSSNTKVVWGYERVNKCDAKEEQIGIDAGDCIYRELITVYLYEKAAIVFVVKEKKLIAVEWDIAFWGDPGNNTRTVNSRVKALHERFAPGLNWTLS